MSVKAPSASQWLTPLLVKMVSLIRRPLDKPLLICLSKTTTNCIRTLYIRLSRSKTSLHPWLPLLKLSRGTFSCRSSDRASTWEAWEGLLDSRDSSNLSIVNRQAASVWMSSFRLSMIWRWQTYSQTNSRWPLKFMTNKNPLKSNTSFSLTILSQKCSLKDFALFKKPSSILTSTRVERLNSTKWKISLTLQDTPTSWVKSRLRRRLDSNSTIFSLHCTRPTKASEMRKLWLWKTS